jgi:hypothetical protein
MKCAMDPRLTRCSWGEADIPAEDVLWKELLIFFMNTKQTSGYMNFLKGIEPREFYVGLMDDYLEW